MIHTLPSISDIRLLELNDNLDEKITLLCRDRDPCGSVFMSPHSGNHGYICNHPFVVIIKGITLLSLQFGASSCVLCTLFNVNSRNSTLYTHSLIHKHWYTHSSAQAGAGVLLWCPSCQVVPLLPGTCHRGDGWLHHQLSPEGNGTLKERNHLSILSSAYFSDGRPPLFFCPPPPPSSPLLRLLCPHHRHPLSSKTLKMKEKKSDRSTVSNLAENVTHASEHKILPRPTHWPQSKSEEAYLNTPFMIMSCSWSKRKFSPFSV